MIGLEISQRWWSLSRGEWVWSGSVVWATGILVRANSPSSFIGTDRGCSSYGPSSSR
jgi:hypothetical protein